MVRTKPAAGSSKSATSTEDLIRGLEATKAGLEVRLSALETAKAAALEQRRDVLISGGDVTEAAKAARVADDDVAATTDALCEVGRRIEAAQAQLLAEEDRGRRVKVAEGLAADAEVVAAEAHRMHEAIASLRATVDRFEFAISGRGSANVDPHSSYVRSPREIAEELIRDGLADAFPFLEIRDNYGMRADGRPAAELGAVYAANLRDIANAVRDGSTPVNVREHEEVEPTFTARRPERHVWVLDPVSYQTDRGEQMVGPGGRSLNVALAEFLIEHDLAAPQKPSNWDARKSHDVRGPTADEHLSIKFNLSDWERADIAEQRAAWQAERDALRAKHLKVAA